MTATEDETYIVRLLWGELLGRNPEETTINQTVASVKTVTVIDAKSVYDCLVKRTGLQQLAEKRTGLELLAYAKCVEEVGIETRWCHSEANLADSLTKINAPGPMQAFMERLSWSIVHDAEQLSARKRQERGLGRLDNNFYQNLAEVLAEHVSKEDPEPAWLADFPNNL